MPHQSVKKTNWFICALVAFVLGFAAFNMRDILFGCTLTVDGITDGATVASLVFPINGSAPHAKRITVDGRSIAIDREGNFSENILLSPGYNIVEVALEDRFGKEKTKTFHLYADPSPAVASIAAPKTN
jgi:hypothetical protein